MGATGEASTDDPSPQQAHMYTEASPCAPVLPGPPCSEQLLTRQLHGTGHGAGTPLPLLPLRPFFEQRCGCARRLIPRRTARAATALAQLGMAVGSAAGGSGGGRLGQGGKNLGGAQRRAVGAHALQGGSRGAGCSVRISTPHAVLQLAVAAWRWGGAFGGQRDAV